MPASSPTIRMAVSNADAGASQYDNYWQNIGNCGLELP